MRLRGLSLVLVLWLISTFVGEKDKIIFMHVLKNALHVCT